MISGKEKGKRGKVIKVLPEYSTIYLGDSARAPYVRRASSPSRCWPFRPESRRSSIPWIRSAPASSWIVSCSRH